MARPLEWIHQTAELGPNGVSETREATADELTELARSLDIPAFQQLRVSYEIKPSAKEHFALKGQISANLLQACIITLEPLATEIDETFAVELRPAELENETGNTNGDLEILTLPDVEPIVDEQIDVGALIYEIVSASLEPYPRKSGAEFDWNDPAQDDLAASGPFAALAKLKANDDKPSG